jgi:hypothetical protein
MVPPSGQSAAERWVADGQRAAGVDLFGRLKSLDLDLRKFILAADSKDLDAFKALGAEAAYPSEQTFHFGEALTNFIREHNSTLLIYFGVGSAPLLEEEAIMKAIECVIESKSPKAYVNNVHSTDWAIFNHPDRILPFQDRLPGDNQLGWVLSNEVDFEVETPSLSASTAVDIGTPSDLVMISGHPKLGKNLREFFQLKSTELSAQVDKLLRILTTPAKAISLIGRSSSHVWGKLEKETKIWIRAFVEERGMVASGRLAEGRVRSLIGEMIEQLGAQSFVQTLTGISDAVLWDTRVWMAHRGGWPSRADRFASDLGRVEEIGDPHLRNLTEAIWKAPIPIITGGHGVVSGNVLSLLETIS